MIDTALHFSGGKDSLACLYLYKEKWNDMYVIWLNTGAAYPETMKYMEMWKERLPHFIEVKTNQPAQVALKGWPVDVLPVNNTLIGRAIMDDYAQPMQSYTDCCSENIWFPLHKATFDLGVKNVVKGQRIEDNRKSISRNGTVVDGMKYVMPIENWSTETVFQYLKEVGADMPGGYAVGEKTGRDCWDCTAYLDENKQRIANLSPLRKEEMKRRLGIIKKAIDDQWHGID